MKFLILAILACIRQCLGNGQKGSIFSQKFVCSLSRLKAECARVIASVIFQMNRPMCTTEGISSSVASRHHGSDQTECLTLLFANSIECESVDCSGSHTKFSCRHCLPGAGGKTIIL